MENPTSNQPQACNEGQRVEQALLGAILIDDAVFGEVAQFVERDCFTQPAHALIFDAMETLHERGLEIDPFSVGKMLEEEEKMDAVGGNTYLWDLSSTVASSWHAVTHAHMVREAWMRRRLKEIGMEMQSEKSPLESDVFNEIDAAQDTIASLVSSLPTSRPTDLSYEMNEALREAEKRRLARGMGVLAFGVTTRFNRLDALLGGMREGELHVLAARPSVGKTAFALGLAVAAAQQGKRVLFFSLEMSKGQLRDRMLTMLGGVRHEQVISGDLTEEELRQAGQRIVSFGPLPLLIDDSASIRLGELCAKAKAESTKRGLDMVIVDYLQLVTVPNLRGNIPREQVVGQISRRLKALSKELQLPVLALAQLNRGVETRAEKRPALADLRESGAIEQDADAVMMLHAPARYGIEQYPNGASTAGAVELMLLKNRKGRCGTVYFDFSGARMQFAESPAQEDRYVTVRPNAARSAEKPAGAKDERKARARYEEMLIAPPEFVETFLQVEERMRREKEVDGYEDVTEAPF